MTLITFVPFVGMNFETIQIIFGPSTSHIPPDSSPDGIIYTWIRSVKRANPKKENIALEVA